MSQGCALLILRSKGQRSRSWRMVIWKWFPDDNWLCNQPMIMKLHTLTPHESRMCPIDFGVKRSTVKVMAHGYLKMVHRNNGCRFEFVGVGGGPVLLQQYFQYAFTCCPYMLPLLFNLECGGRMFIILMKLYIMTEDDLIMLKVGMYENSQKQGSYRREKSGESYLKKNWHMNA